MAARLLVCGVLPVVLGCGGSDGGDTVLVSGAVDIDGEPLVLGRISFVPIDGKGASTSAEVEGGRYSTTVPPGTKRVSITAERSLGMVKAYPDDPESPEHESFEQYVAAEFNKQSTLEIDIPVEGLDDADFEVKAKK